MRSSRFGAVAAAAVVRGVTGDSDIRGITVQTGRSDDHQRQIRVQVRVREIDRSSNSTGRSGTGLATRVALSLDTGLQVAVTGQPRAYAVRYKGDLSCFGPEDDLEPVPDLRYRRYTDTITMTVDGGCFDDAETASVKVRTTSLRKSSRLVDWAATEPVVLGEDDTE